MGDSKAVISKQTQQALFELHVDAFLEGIVEALPDPKDWGLSLDEGRKIRNAVVLETLSRTDWTKVG